MKPPGLGLDIIVYQANPFPCHVSDILHHRDLSGASDQGSWFAGLLLLERRQKHIALVLLTLGELEIGLPCSFLSVITPEIAGSWLSSTDVGSRELR